MTEETCEYIQNEIQEMIDKLDKWKQPYPYQSRETNRQLDKTIEELKKLKDQFEF